uniref:C-CAP/cofactor C-like domain-containing protein n=1 Tax=Strongyloides papillosus TaxID=174720 RepID=A0A0N5C947_STREA
MGNENEQVVPPSSDEGVDDLGSGDGSSTNSNGTEKVSEDSSSSSPDKQVVEPSDEPGTSKSEPSKAPPTLSKAEGEEDPVAVLERMLKQANDASVHGTSNDRLLSSLQLQMFKSNVELPAYWVKKIDTAVQKLCPMPPKTSKGFSFTKRNATPQTKRVGSVEAKKLLKSNDILNNHGDSFNKSKAVCINNENDADRQVSGVDGSDVRISNIKDCSFGFTFHPSSVIIKDIDNCTLLFPPCKSSILIQNCSRSNIGVVAQQIRIHSTRNTSILSNNSNIIIEDCHGIKVGDYPKAGLEKEKIFDIEKAKVQDFNWLVNNEQSPNWSYI